MNRIDVVFAADRRYLPHLATAICSLVANNEDQALRIHVINSDIDASQWQALASIGDGGVHEFSDIKISERDLAGALVNQHFSKAIYYRLFAPERIPATKALYLDSDIVVTSSIADLWRTELETHVVAAVEDPGFSDHRRLGMDPGARYFNSGVMLVDLEAWRQANMKSRVLEFVRENTALIQFPDQCAMNAIINGKWLPLAPTYNAQSIFFELTEDTLARIFGPGPAGDALRTPTVIHFSGASKPWHMNCRHPFKPVYWKYRNRTRYRAFLPDDFGIWTTLKYVAPDVVKHAIKAMLRRRSGGLR